jgi:UDP-N-acetylmuramyl pentapeptide synthase
MSAKRIREGEEQLDDEAVNETAANASAAGRKQVRAQHNQQAAQVPDALVEKALANVRKLASKPLQQLTLKDVGVTVSTCLG